MRILVSAILILFCTAFTLAQKAKPEISGEQKKWHKITLTFDGVETSETATPNPFLQYRLNVVFTHEKSFKSYLVPGYFAADGKAGATSAVSGNKWRVHFSPDETGEWRYEVSFRRNPNSAIVESSSYGASAGFMDGTSGAFTVSETDKTGRDFRSKGRLQYIGEHYLRFAETGEYFLKQGPDSPENLLAFADFDGTFQNDEHKDNLVKKWQPHVQDWKTGDPTWQNGKGKGLIGALNYIASKKQNSISFLTNNILGDDQNVFPYINYDTYDRFDISKLDQWEIVFEHAQKLGLFLHFKTLESENQGMLDGGGLGVTRKLYYRELIARFGHHLALNWNLGEENGQWQNNHLTNPQSKMERLSMANYFANHDPYKHLIVIHNGIWFHDLLGKESGLTGISIQTPVSEVYKLSQKWRELSAATGKKWAVANDEQNPAEAALPPDEIDPNHDDSRKDALWGCLLGGCWGNEWYFGYKHPNSDLTAEDYRTREKFWEQTAIALDFFKDNKIPFWEMDSAEEYRGQNVDYLFARGQNLMVLYLKKGGEGRLRFRPAQNGIFSVKWFNPRLGGKLQDGSITKIDGRGQVSIGTAPDEKDKDWVVLLNRIGTLPALNNNTND